MENPQPPVPKLDADKGLPTGAGGSQSEKKDTPQFNNPFPDGKTMVQVSKDVRTALERRFGTFAQIPVHPRELLQDPRLTEAERTAIRAGGLGIVAANGEQIPITQDGQVDDLQLLETYFAMMAKFQQAGTQQGIGQATVQETQATIKHIQASLQKISKEAPVQLTESERQRELINQALQAGRSTMYTWSTEGTGVTNGYRTVYEKDDRRSHLSDQSELIREPLHEALGHEPERDQFLADEGIYEAVVMAPLTRDVKEMRKVSEQQKTFFSTKSVEVEREVVVGQEPQTMDEYMENGSKERAFVLYYHATDRHHANQYTEAFARQMGYPWSELKERRELYKDLVDRPGNGLFMQFVLPWDLGQQFSEEIQRDPTFVRKLTDAFAQQKYSEDFLRDNWRKHARPPYDGWNNYPVNRMYFTDLVSRPEPPSSDKQQVEKHVIEFKTEGSIANPDTYHANVLKKPQ